jgi:hypothetical protein
MTVLEKFTVLNLKANDAIHLLLKFEGLLKHVIIPTLKKEDKNA